MTIRLTPGLLPRASIGGTVAMAAHRDLLAEAETQARLQDDLVPIPTPAERGHYFGGRDLEYWLSGLLDARRLAACMPAAGAPCRYLDFGGGAGRVVRHLTGMPHREVWLCDTDDAAIGWAHRNFGQGLTALRTGCAPPLPMPDGYFDAISAFSVFTRMDEGEIPWLLELRRVARPGGVLYVSVLDEHAWSLFKRHTPSPSPFDRSLTSRTVLAGSAAGDAVVFRTESYIRQRWGAFFASVALYPRRHNNQAVAVLRCR